MKFGKVLKVSSENMPAEMHDLFLRYKELKKQIKLIPVSKDAAAGEKQASVSPDGSVTGSGSGNGAAITTVLSQEEQAFITTLNEDLARFNRYFIEKEEEAVIRIQALCDELAAAKSAAGLDLPPALTGAASVSLEHKDVTHPYPTTRPIAATAASGPVPPTQPQQRPPPQGTAETSAAAACPLDAESMDSKTVQVASPSDQQEQQRQDEEQPAEKGNQRPSTQQEQLLEQQRQQRNGNHNNHHQHHHSHHYYHPSGPPSTTPSSSPHLAALQEVKSRLVQFHGEMVLLLHWSLLNYAAVVKILKKHDKRTGVLLRAPYLANVLQQPFSSTTIMSRLAKRAEELVVATTQLSPVRTGGGQKEAVASGGGTAAPAAAVTGPVVMMGPGPPSSFPSQLRGAPDVAVRGGAAAAAAAAVVAAPSGRGSVTASDISALTFADREGCFGDVGSHREPLVGSTMHALETWAKLRKNAITPSTVLEAATAAEQQPQPQPQPQPQSGAKRKAAEGSEQAAHAVDGAGKVARQEEEDDERATEVMQNSNRCCIR